MNGYLGFLKSLSQYQQRAEIGRLAFTERSGGCSLEEDLLQTPAMIAYTKSLGVNPALWEFDLSHYAEEPDVNWNSGNLRGRSQGPVYLPLRTRKRQKSGDYGDH
jgi:hypothetical protein